MIHFFYTQLIKPVFFLFDAEMVHDGVTALGELLGRYRVTRVFTKYFFYYKNESFLSQTIDGILFENPIGLAAGFDYEAKLTQILPSVGFGFNTVGSITYGAYSGNKKPRLGRLPLSRSLLVNKGLKNNGVHNVVNKLERYSFEIPLGLSIAKTNSPTTITDKTGIEDYVKSAKILNEANIASFYEINISCPNAFGGEPFVTSTKLEKLLATLDKVQINKPVFIKMPIEITNKEARVLLDIIIRHKVNGVIFGNLLKDRTNPMLNKSELSKVGKGHFSGKPTFEKSNRLIEFTYKKYGKKLTIIGCGGVFSAEDAYYKIKLGASLVQLITGMVFEGPQLISDINKGLVKLLKKDGFSNVSEAVGRGV